MNDKKLQITPESVKNELKTYEDNPEKCLFEYIWNSFDANATEIKISFKKPMFGLNIDILTIEDNGDGWDLEDEKDTRRFLDSTKAEVQDESKKSLPRGKLGRGRYAFIWFAKTMEVYSKGNKLELQNDNLQVEPKKFEYNKKGTKIDLLQINQKFSNFLSSDTALQEKLVLEFCWLLKQNSQYKIYVNDSEIDISKNIKYSEIYKKEDFSDEIKKSSIDNFQVEIVLWKDNPKEKSSFYFLDAQQREKFTKTTRLNRKKDNFWHSVYIESNLFNDKEFIDSDKEIQSLDFENQQASELERKIVEEIKKKIISIRKPILEVQSDIFLKEQKQKQMIPKLSEFDVDEESYDMLIKTVYTISPSLFVGKRDNEKKFIFATFASLLSTQDNHLIKLVINQLQELSLEEQEDLKNILQRTTLSHAIKTLKEVDKRLQVIHDISELLFKYEKETLEVPHLQSFLDENFWIFGEQFKLFSSTEGRLKDTLFKYAKNILRIEKPSIESESRKELDIFLTKRLHESEERVHNVIVEIKRPSIRLSKKEYDQIENYCEEIMKESICNGDNQTWEFYLIGNDYDEHVKKRIENLKHQGESKKGLTYNVNDGKTKIYVRKWTDIVDAEWGYKLQYLKEKLQIKPENNGSNPNEISKNQY